MKVKLAHSDAEGGRAFVVVFEPGEEAVAGLQRFAEAQEIDGAQISAIGALERGVAAWFNWGAKTYEPIEVNEQCEVIFGHLQVLHVRPTLEAIVTETPTHLKRKKRPELGGIALIDLEATERR